MGSKDWETPDNFYNRVNAAYGPFALDAAATEQNTKCLIWIDEQADGLKQPWGWGRKVWVNPPYTNLKDWVNKAIWEQEKNSAYIVMLLPWSQWAQWMEEVAAHAEIVRIVGRIKFVDPDEKDRSQPNGQNILAVFRPPLEGLQWPVGFCGGKILAEW